MATKYNTDINEEDERILFCLTQQRWSKILDEASSSRDCDLLQTFNAESLIIDLKTHGLTKDEEDIVKLCTTKKSKSHALLGFLRLRPTLALVFIDLLFKYKFKEVSKMMLQKFRKIKEVTDEELFRKNVSRQHELLEYFVEHKTSFLSKDCITNSEWKRIENSSDRKFELIEILNGKTVTEYQLLIDFLIEMNMTFAVSALLNPVVKTEYQDCSLRWTERSVNSQPNDLHSEESEELTITANHNVDKKTEVVVEYESKEHKWKFCPFSISRSMTIETFHSSVRRSIQSDIVPNSSTNCKYFFCCMMVLIREWTGKFRYSWEAFTDEDLYYRNFVDVVEDSSPGELVQIAFLPLIGTFPEIFFNAYRPARFIIRADVNCEFWKMKNLAFPNNDLLTRLDEDVDAIFQDLRYVAFMKGLAVYNPNQDMPYRHLIRLTKGSFLDVSTGNNVAFSEFGTYFRDSVFTPTLIFLSEGEQIPKLKRKSKHISAPMMFLREGISLTISEGCIKRLCPDQSVGSRWLFDIDQNPVVRNIIDYFFQY